MILKTSHSNVRCLFFFPSQSWFIEISYRDNSIVFLEESDILYTHVLEIKKTARIIMANLISSEIPTRQPLPSETMAPPTHMVYLGHHAIYNIARFLPTVDQGRLGKAFGTDERQVMGTDLTVKQVFLQNILEARRTELYDILSKKKIKNLFEQYFGYPLFSSLGIDKLNASQIHSQRLAIIQSVKEELLTLGDDAQDVDVEGAIQHPHQIARILSKLCEHATQYEDFFGCKYEDFSREKAAIPKEISQHDRLLNLRNWLSSESVETDDVFFSNGKQTKEISPDLFHFKSALIVNLNFNKITSIPPEIANLHHVRAILLDKNELTSLPPEICLLPDLRMLTVSNNKLLSLPSDIGRLTQLETLNVSHNNLTELPLSLFDLPNLTMLDVRGNPCVPDLPQDKIEALEARGCTVLRM